MISQTAEYALRAVVFLAEHPDSRWTAQRIAETTQVPSGYLSKILQGLARHDIVDSQRGVGGGFTLNRPAGAISIYEVLQAVDPMRRILSCPLKLEAHATRLCPLHARLDRSMEAIEAGFRETVLSELLQQPTFRSPDRSPTAGD
jgi:Rrf2 family protein